MNLKGVYETLEGGYDLTSEDHRQPPTQHRDRHRKGESRHGPRIVHESQTNNLLIRYIVYEKRAKISLGGRRKEQ